MRSATGMMHSWCLALAVLALTLAPAVAQSPNTSTAWAKPNGAGTEPVWIGLDDAFGLKTNTSATAIEWGIQAAMQEINAAGGVLNGRPLRLLSTDNKGITARGVDNFVKLASTQDLVAVLGGKYSPIIVAALPEAHRLKVPLISVWGSADPITDHEHRPSYSFRVSLKDDWGVEAMMKRLSVSHKVRHACAILPNTAWGRSAQRVIEDKTAASQIRFAALRWYNWGDGSFSALYQECLAARAQGVLLVGNENEAAGLIRAIAAQPPHLRLPVVSHWGAVGGTLHELAGEALPQVRVEFIQTFSFIQNPRPRAQALAQWILRQTGMDAVSDIPSPVGAAHAYDTVHMLAMAIDKAQSTEAPKIRDAMENLPAFNGAVRYYTRPFTGQRHDALDKSQLLFVRMTPTGQLIPQN